MTDFAKELESYLPPDSNPQKTYITYVKTPKQYENAIKNLPDNCSMYCITLNGSPCAHTKCVGYCWSKLHKGYITKNQMEQHQCIEKHCKSFQKIADAPYWINKEAKIQARKSGKQLKKQIAAEETAFLQEIRDITIHDFNFYPVAVELKNDTFEVRIINFEPVDYSQYISLLSSAADGRRIYFQKIITNDTRKRLIIETNNIIKVPAPSVAERFNIFTRIKKLFTSAQNYLKKFFK